VTPDPRQASRSARGDAADGSRRARRAGIVAGVAFGLLGWRGLLVPSLIRSLEPAFHRSDAEIGSYFLATALSYAVGSLLGGRLIRSIGARATLPGAVVLIAAGLAVQAVTSAWLVFSIAGVVVSLGASTTDVGSNALILDLFPHIRGRALNLLHLAYSAAALVAPLALAFAVGAGFAWQAAFAGTAVVAVFIAAALAVTVPRDPVRLGAAASRRDVAGRPVAPDLTVAPPAGLRRLPGFLLVLALATGCYVAAESGTSDWLIRYLADLPLAVAGSALTLFWGGLAIGRVVFARIGNRWEPLGMAAAAAVVASGLMVLAVLLPVSGVSPVLFGLAGVAFGPVFPLVVAAAGARMPGRSSTVTMTLTFSAVVGAIVYPPAMGLMSVTVGLQVAMIGTAILLLATGLAIAGARRVPAPA